MASAPSSSTRVKKTIENSPIHTTDSPTRLNGKKINDKRFSTFSSLKAMSGRGAYVDENGVRWVSVPRFSKHHSCNCLK